MSTKRAATTYDIIYLADDEWGNEKMHEVAMAHFAKHSDCQFILVYEHGGWFLGYRRDGSYWGSANDRATMDKAARPTAFSGVSIRRGPSAAHGRY